MRPTRWLLSYNKMLLGDDLGKFPAPLLMNAVHFFLQALLSNVIVWWREERVTMSWRDYLSRGTISKNVGPNARSTGWLTLRSTLFFVQWCRRRLERRLTSTWAICHWSSSLWLSPQWSSLCDFSQNPRFFSSKKHLRVNFQSILSAVQIFFACISSRLCFCIQVCSSTFFLSH